jgi:hypothetical protein
MEIEKQKMEKLESLIKIIEGNRGKVDGEEPILEAIFEILLDIQKAIFKKLENYTSGFLESPQYKEMVEKNYKDLSNQTNLVATKGSSDSNPKLDDSDSGTLKIRKNQHRYVQNGNFFYNH